MGMRKRQRLAVCCALHAQMSSVIPFLLCSAHGAKTLGCWGSWTFEHMHPLRMCNLNFCLTIIRG